MSKLDIRFVHQEHDFSMANSITGLHLKSSKSQSSEKGKEEPCLDVVIELQKMHVCRNDKFS